MTQAIRDGSLILEQAISGARNAGVGEEAEQLQSAISAAFTTSSELISEQGEAILRFVKATRGRLPVGVKVKLDACLAEIGRTWSPYRRFPVWVYRKFVM
jgi:hypothetical protein